MQMTLEDVLNPTEIIPWHRDFDVWRCDILAPIPTSVLSPTERYEERRLQLYTTEVAAERKRQDEIWSKYTMLIWHYELSKRKCDWMEAGDILKRHRLSGEPAWMQLWSYRGDPCRFVPPGIIQYA